MGKSSGQRFTSGLERQVFPERADLKIEKEAISIAGNCRKIETVRFFEWLAMEDRG